MGKAPTDPGQYLGTEKGAARKQKKNKSGGCRSVEDADLKGSRAAIYAAENLGHDQIRSNCPLLLTQKNHGWLQGKWQI